MNRPNLCTNTLPHYHEDAHRRLFWRSPTYTLPPILTRAPAENSPQLFVYAQQLLLETSGSPFLKESSFTSSAESTELSGSFKIKYYSQSCFYSRYFFSNVIQEVNFDSLHVSLNSVQEK